MKGFDVFSRLITYYPTGISNPHNRTPLQVKVLRRDVPTGYEFFTSDKYARIIQDHFCGIPGCKCKRHWSMEVAPQVFKLYSNWVLKEG
jgi:hypothetical protein